MTPSQQDTLTLPTASLVAALLSTLPQVQSEGHPTDSGLPFLLFVPLVPLSSVYMQTVDLINPLMCALLLHSVCPPVVVSHFYLARKTTPLHPCSCQAWSIWLLQCQGQQAAQFASTNCEHFNLCALPGGQPRASCEWLIKCTLLKEEEEEKRRLLCPGLAVHVLVFRMWSQ